MTAPRNHPTSSPALLSFRSGGWVILLAVLLVSTVVFWRVASMRSGHGSRAIGDGRNTFSYRFDLSACLIPRGEIVPCGIPKDGLPALDAPTMMSTAALDETNRRMRGKYLVPSDRVIGVCINGQARAYPLRVLAWHEVANDTVGGKPIVVTYHPLCDSAAVFDRRVDGQTLTFGFSGLLYNSNLLMYDRQADAVGESLWSQLQFRAVAGPAAAAGRRLSVLPTCVVRWEVWRKRHPDTEVFAPDQAHMDRYKRDPYISYYGSDQLRYPVHPLPPQDGLANKTPVIAVRTGDDWRVFSLATIAEQVAPSGTWPGAGGTTAWVYSFWFAWYAMHPDSTLE